MMDDADLGHGWSYGDSSHFHAATSSTSGETASYDTNGDMQCRAPTSATTCAGTPTGAHLDYDAERRLSHWQSALLMACVFPRPSCTLELTIAEGDGIERG